MTQVNWIDQDLIPHLEEQLKAGKCTWSEMFGEVHNWLVAHRLDTEMFSGDSIEHIIQRASTNTGLPLSQ